MFFLHQFEFTDLISILNLLFNAAGIFLRVCLCFYIYHDGKSRNYSNTNLFIVLTAILFWIPFLVYMGMRKPGRMSYACARCGKLVDNPQFGCMYCGYDRYIPLGDPQAAQLHYQKSLFWRNLAIAAVSTYGILLIGMVVMIVFAAFQAGFSY